MNTMLHTIKRLVCVATVILALSETDAYPTVWKNDVTDFTDEEPLTTIHLYFNNCSNAVDQDISPGVCGSEICQQDATEILESLDKSVDPCDDFYMFACGGWKEKHPATNDTPMYSRDAELTDNLLAQIKLTLEAPISEDDISPLKEAKKMYTVCMDVEAIERAGIQPLVDLSNELGGWPMALEHWNEDNFTLEGTLAGFERLMAWNPLFYSLSFFHINDSSRRYVQIAENTGDLPSINLLDLKFEEKRAEFELTIANTTFYIMNTTGVNIDEDSVSLQASQMFDFIIQLKNLTSENTSIESITLKKFQELTDSALVVNAYAQFNWLSYLNKILSDTDIVLDEDEEIDIMDTEYWIRLFQLMDKTPPRVIANYLQWIFIYTFKGKTEMWEKDHVEQLEQMTRSEQCSKVTRERYNHAINSIHAPGIYTDYDKHHFNMLIEHLLSVLIKTVSNVTRLDDDSRSAVLERLETMKAYSGYPEIYTNASALLDYYKKVRVGNVHFNNMLIDSTVDYERSLRFLRHPVYENHDVWEFPPEMLLAFYDTHVNYLLISFGHLQSFYFNVESLLALTYGRLGSIVGHEMMHGITTTYGDDWNDNTTKLFYNTQCIIDQYDNYHIPELEEIANRTVTLNGTETLQENIGDIYGMDLAYEAYQSLVKLFGKKEQSLPGLEEYSPNQLFYIGYAMSWCESRTDESMAFYLDDVHSPPFARVRGSMSNMDNFARAFNCPAGSVMNPVDKCRLW